VVDTEYSVTVTDAFGCENADTVQVNVNPLPTADAGADQDICLGETATISATGGGGYAWNHGATTASDNVTPTSDTEYIVTVTDANGCSDSDSVMINVFSVTADAGADQEICMGETATLSASGGSSYAWSTGDNTQDINVSPTADTEYIVTVTGVNSCTDADTVEVIVHPLPTAEAGANTDICQGSSTTLSASGGVDYLWSTTETTADILSGGYRIQRNRNRCFWLRKCRYCTS